VRKIFIFIVIALLSLGAVRGCKKCDCPIKMRCPDKP